MDKKHARRRNMTKVKKPKKKLEPKIVLCFSVGAAWLLHEGLKRNFSIEFQRMSEGRDMGSRQGGQIKGLKKGRKIKKRRQHFLVVVGQSVRYIYEPISPVTLFLVSYMARGAVCVCHVAGPPERIAD